MTLIATKQATLQLLEGMARYTDDPMRVVDPVLRRQRQEFRQPLKPTEQYYWLVRTVTNYLLDFGCGCGVVVGIVVVFAYGAELTVFAGDFAQIGVVNRQGALASYKFTAQARTDADWLLLVSRECEDNPKCKRV